MRIGIIGFGRFAQIFSKFLKTGADIFVTGHGDKSREAKEIGVAWRSFDDIFDVDLLILSVPISKLKGLLFDIKDKVKPNTIIMDVCSVKTYPCSWMKEILIGEFQLIGTHPMFGPDSAKESLVGRQIVLCPINISGENLEKLTELFKDINLEIIVTTPDDHDIQTARSLALVHFIGRSLAKTDINKERISTLGFERLLAVKDSSENDSWQLFEDMNTFNPYAALVRSQFLNNASLIDQELRKRRVS